MSGAPKSCLKRSSVTEHGMAYRARAPRSRRANSTREGNVSPGRTGEPCTGGSGPGGQMIKVVRYECCGSPKQNWSSPELCSVKTTGELIDIERVTISSEGGCWKSAYRGNSLAAYPTSRGVRRGTVGKVPTMATRWRSTL